MSLLEVYVSYSVLCSRPRIWLGRGEAAVLSLFEFNTWSSGLGVLTIELVGNWEITPICPGTMNRRRSRCLRPLAMLGQLTRLDEAARLYDYHFFFLFFFSLSLGLLWGFRLLVFLAVEVWMQFNACHFQLRSRPWKLPYCYRFLPI